MLVPYINMLIYKYICLRKLAGNVAPFFLCAALSRESSPIPVVFWIRRGPDAVERRGEELTCTFITWLKES